MRAGPPRFANAVLILTLAYSAAWTLYTVLGHKPHLYQKLGPAAVALACLLLFRCGRAARETAAISLIGLLAGLYATELALGTIDPEDRLRRAIGQQAAQAGIAYDVRTRFEVIAALRSQGIAAYPPLYPHLLLHAPLSVDGRDTIPLASLPHAETVSCNEGGQYLRFTTDERGFRNPGGAWRKGSIQLGIIGDSMAMGECVSPAENTIAGEIRTRYPDTITAGSGGDGPLLELATLREYLSLVKPAIVLWFFYEGNDMADLEKEKTSPILMRYLEPEFRQGLAQKQETVNQAIAGYFERALAAERGGERKPSWSARAKGFLVLENVRGLLNRLIPDPPHTDFAMLREILRQARDTVDSWNGRMVLCYLPAPARYPGQFLYSPKGRAALDEMRRQVLGMARELHLPAIDGSASFPDGPEAQAGNAARYFYPYLAHYRPEGHHVLGRAIVEGLAGATR